MRIRQEKVTEVSIARSDGLQECLETLRDLKANNVEEGYLKGMEKKHLCPHGEAPAFKANGDSNYLMCLEVFICCELRDLSNCT